MKYYQIKNQEPSFVVWNSLNQCMKDNNCGKEEIKEYKDGDIEAPKFYDIDIYENNEIKLFLLNKLIYDNVDEVRSFFDINNKSFNHGMTAFLGYECTDEDTDQYVKMISENIFFIIEKDSFHKICLYDYSENEIEEFVSSYYDNGLSQIKKDYGSEWRQIVAEIIAESL